MTRTKASVPRPLASFLGFFLLALSSPGPSSSVLAQGTTFTRIADTDTAVNVLGDRPALHQGEVAFLGLDSVTRKRGIYKTRADGLGPFLLVADEQTPVPNAPGFTFARLDNPAIHRGQVFFTGGHQVDITDGMYAGAGGPLAVLVDYWTGGDPPPFGPAPGLPGQGFKSDVGSFPVVWFRDSGGSITGVAGRGTAMPGGGTFVDGGIPENPTFGGGLLAFTGYVNHSNGVDGGVYTFDPASGVIDLVANWDTQMPGRSDFFDFFHRSDTDGQQVVFFGKTGFTCCGGHSGIYLAPARGGGTGPVTTLAEMGDPAPGLEGFVFDGFGSVAVDGDLVVFEGFAEKGANNVVGLYGVRSGKVFKILDSRDQLGGKDIADVDMNFRGLDQGRLVFRARFVVPGSPYPADPAYYVADLSTGGQLDRHPSALPDRPRPIR